MVTNTKAYQKTLAAVQGPSAGWVIALVIVIILGIIRLQELQIEKTQYQVLQGRVSALERRMERQERLSRPYHPWSSEQGHP